jgi:integrase
MQLGWLDRNPFRLGKRLIDQNAEEPAERALEYDEEVRLLAACEGPDVYEYERKGKTVRVVREVNPRMHLKPVIIFAIESGMRKNEIFTTRRTQIDFERHLITLNPKQTKALKRRFIPMSDRLENALKELLAARPFGKEELIFAGLKDCDRAFATACRRAGIEGLTFHALRHTAMTYMDEAGISDPARRNIGGHGSVRVGQRYTNPTQDNLDSSRVKLNEFRERLEKRQLKERDDKVAGG